MATTTTLSGGNVVPSGSSLTINSGASIVAAAGSTVTGFGLAAGSATVQVTGSNFTTTSLTMVTATGLTSATLAVNSLYEVDVMLRVQSTTTAGLKVGFSNSTGSPKLTGWLLQGDAAGAAGTSGFASAFGSAIVNSLALTANTDAFVWIKGIIITDAGATNIQCGVLKVTSGTATVYIGSRMTLTKLS